MITNTIIPFCIAAIVLYGITKKVPVFQSFVAGAKEGVSSAFSLLPTLIGITACIRMFEASGGLDLLVQLLSDPAKLLHFPAEVLPLALLRPISGSGSLVVFENILKTFSPDSYIGKVASVLQGSSETTFYTISVYYAASSVKKTGHTLICSLAGDVSCFLFSALWVTLLCR